MEDLTKKDMNQKEQNFLIGIQERFFLANGRHTIEATEPAEI